MAAFEGRDFLVTAGLLATQPEDEGAQRSAISRAYYACFHRARDYSRARSANIRRDGSAHVAVRRFLGTSDPRIEWDLLRLHTLRTHADYDIPFPGGQPASTAGVALTLASEILARIDALSGTAVLPSEEE